jgi:hypothetical protein
MKTFFSLLLFIVTTVLGARELKELKTGTYDLVGTNSSGETYRGQVVIAPQGKNYAVVWLVGSRQAQIGVGIYNSWEDLFSVAFADHGRYYWGVVSYKVGAWGELEGKWASSDGRGQGVERLKWVNSSY